MIIVTVREKDGEVSHFEFSGFPIGIGRAKGNDIVLPRGNVTKEHALLHVENGNVMISDAGSTNGVYINGRKIQPANPSPVYPADKIYIGDFILSFDLVDKSRPAPSEPAPPEVEMNDPMRDSAAQSLKKHDPTHRESVNVTSAPSHVTVYARGAEVRRSLDAFDVPAESFELRVPDITEFADPSSFRFDLGETNRELVSVRTELHYPSDIGSFGDTVEELEEVRREIGRLDERRGILESRKQKLVRLEFTVSRHDDDHDASERASRGLAIAASADERIATYDAQLVELADQLFELRRREAKLELEDEQTSDVDRVGTTRPRRVVIARFRAGEPQSFRDVTLTYVVQAARWWPVYRVDLSDQGRRAAVGIEALVAQNSGENWENVTMSFSTSDLNVDARLPRLLSLRLGRAQRSVSTGFRPPPEGTDALFASFDQAFPRGVPAAHELQHDVAMRQSAPSQMVGGSLNDEVTGEYATAASEFEAEAEIWEEVAAMDMPMPAPQAAMAPPKSSGFFGGSGGAPPARSAAAAPGGGARAKRKRPAPAPPPPPEATEPESGWLDFDNLRMAGPRSPGRGKLTVERPSYGAGHNLTSANETAQKLGVIDPIVSRGSFDYRYDTDGLADVPSDGMVHRLTVTTAETTSKLSWRTVPREDESAYRIAELDNPHDSPLLTGPVEVYSDGGLITRTKVSHVGKGGSMTIGLGVDERIRVARNARVEEESAGLLGGKREVLHHVEIELRSNLGFEAEVEVLDRIPVTDDDEVNVELESSSPKHRRYDQKKEGRPIRGGLQWSLELGAGSKSKIEFTYKIILRAKDEIIGGNRRE